MVRIKVKPFRLFLPLPANVLIDSQTPKRLETFGDIVSHQEHVQMLRELLV
jgi:hypothetical protein